MWMFLWPNAAEVGDAVPGKPQAWFGALTADAPAGACWAYGHLSAQGVVSIPVTKRRSYLEENAAAAGLDLGPAEIAELADVVPVGAAHGSQYDEAGMKQTYP